MAAPPASGPHAALGRGLALTVALAALGYLALTAWAGWDEVSAALRALSPALGAGLLALSLANYGLRFLRWHGYIALLGGRVPVGANLRIYLGGFALTTTPGKAGELARSLWLRDFGVRARASVAAFFAERIQDLGAVALLASLGLSLYPAGRWLILACAAGAVVLLALLAHPGWIRALDERARRGRSRLATVLHHLAGLALEFRHCFAPRPFALGLALGVVAWGAEAVAFWWLLSALGAPLPLPVSVAIYSFSMLAGGLSFLPGGLGGAEAAMLLLLKIAQVPGAEAVAATVIIRLTTLWFAVALGGLVLAAGRPRPAAGGTPA